MYTATEVAKLLNNQTQLLDIKESNIEYVAKKKPVQLKKAPKEEAKVAKKTEKKVKKSPQIKIWDTKKPLEKNSESKIPRAFMEQSGTVSAFKNPPDMEKRTSIPKKEVKKIEPKEPIKKVLEIKLSVKKEPKKRRSIFSIFNRKRA